MRFFIKTTIKLKYIKDVFLSFIYFLKFLLSDDDNNITSG
ncbi:hypothetical protein SAMN05661044_03080 [Olivibacter domesticus]|uniref:Uncharacterized protein n=1 Tax=Olivibacter domesticus TaxID=407022 RepID=A0A1H7S5Z9_OLID1|nr:hypothetical protein SAMN05661044_03080 [Olivibacter domesticus]